MSDSIFRIWSIALYEAKVIMRGWLFRIAFLLPLLFLSIFFFTSIFRTLFYYSFFVSFYRMPSAIPWIVTVFYTIYSCIVLAAVSTSSGTMESRLDTLDGLRVRPWSNIEYAAGKLAGQLGCFSVMTVSVLLLTLGVVIFNSRLFVIGAGYLIYPLIIFFPAFFCVAGLSMFVSQIFRNQMFSLLIVMTVVLSSMFVADWHFHLLDITAFRLPIFFSGITGFSFPELTALHRLLFLSAGLMLVFATVIISRRPPGRRLVPVVASTAAVLLLFVSLGAGYGYSDYFSSGIEMRRDIRETGRSIRPVPRLEALEYDIDVGQEGRGIDCDARIVLKNRSAAPVDRYILTLNPGLKVTGVSDVSGAIDFDREIHLLTVYPSGPLGVGESDTIEIRYEGIVDERAMFSDVPERIRCAGISFAAMTDMDPLSGLKLIRIRREIAPVRYDYMLLIPDAMWYPVLGLPYDPNHPADDHRDFARFRMTVMPREGLSAVSQGERTVGEKGGFVFEPEYPLPGITLAIGDFRTRSVEVDSLKYYLHSTPDSEALVRMMECVSDTLPAMIAEWKDRLEYSLGLGYPFKRLTCLEVPASFSPFRRPLRDSGFGYAQPEIFLVHERALTLGMATITPWTLSVRKYNPDEKEREGEWSRSQGTRTVSSLIMEICQNGEFNITPMYFRHATGINSSRYPHLGLMFDYFAGIDAIWRRRGRYFLGNEYTGDEQASRLVLSGEFPEAVMEPVNYRWAGSLIHSWASHHYYLIDAMSESESIARFLRDLVEENRFRNIEEDTLLDSFAERFGFRLESVIVDLENPVVIPGYVCVDFDCCSFVDQDRERYRLSFEAWNREETTGVIVVTAALIYPMSARKTRMRKLNNPVVAMEVMGPGESRRIEFEVDYKPITVWINTMISRNVPSQITWGPGIEVRASCGGRQVGFESVDLADFDEEGLIVDDLDPGFETSGGSREGILKKLFPLSGDEREFIDIRGIHRDPPSKWSRIIGRRFFGVYERTARCLKAGKGDSRAIWRVKIPDDGYYDVYCHFFDRLRKYSARARSRYGLDRTEYHYTIHHSEGSSEVVLKFEQCDDGWNLVGRYFFEEGEAIIELSDESPAGYIIADAVKWVKKK